MPQLVKVVFDDDNTVNQRSYTYRWTGSVPLDIGDRVLVPASNWSREPKHATVADATSDYEGPVKNIIGVVVNRATGQLYEPPTGEAVIATPKPAGW